MEREQDGRGNLVVSRRKGESIEIDRGRITISVVEFRGNSVRLSVRAPQDVDIVRSEVEFDLELEPVK